MVDRFPIHISAATEDSGKRLDQLLTLRLESVSRARVQEMIAEGKVLVNDAAAKASLKLRGGERISVLGEAQRAPLKAIAEKIPLDIVYEDENLAVINKPAGMMVHAGAGATDDARNRGTLVNALLHHLGNLSGVGGELRPGIVHRLDKETSGLIVVAKNDDAHRKLLSAVKNLAQRSFREAAIGYAAYLTTSPLYKDALKFRRTDALAFAAAVAKKYATASNYGAVLRSALIGFSLLMLDDFWKGGP